MMICHLVKKVKNNATGVNVSTFKEIVAFEISIISADGLLLIVSAFSFIKRHNSKYHYYAFFLSF